MNIVENSYNPLSVSTNPADTKSSPYKRIKDLIGKFIILDLVKMETGDQIDYLYLTQQGKAFIRNNL